MEKSKGFTMIELLVVIMIIGILAAIAIPAFLGQRTKAKVREGDILAGDARKEIVEFYWHTGRFPKDNAEAGLSEPEHLKGKFVDSITVQDGVLEIKYNDEVDDGLRVEHLRPAILINDPTAPVQWLADYEEVPPGWTVPGEGGR